MRISRNVFAFQLIAVAFAFFLVSIGSIYPASDSDSFQLSLEPYFCNRYGSIGEYVFDLSGYGTDVSYAPEGSRQISRLDWDVLPVYVSGIGIDLGYCDVQSRISMEFGLPLTCGHMQDYDWAATAGHQTHYSFHENKLTGYFALAASFGWSFPLVNSRLEIIPLVGVDFSDIAFEAADGYKQYVSSADRATTPWSDDIERTAMSGSVITYRQKRWLLRLGPESHARLHPRLSLGLGLFVSPVLNIDSFDSHLRTGYDYLDYHMNGAVSLEAWLSGEFSVFDRHSIVLRVDGSFQTVADGYTYIKAAEDLTYSKISGSLGGASRWLVGVSLGWRWRIL